MTPAAIASAAAQSHLTAEMLEATLIEAGYTLEQRNEIAALWEVQDAKYANTLATGTMAATEEGATGATWSLTAAMDGLGKVMKAHPVLSFLAIAAVAIPVVIKLFDWLTTSLEEQRQKLSDAKQAYDDTVSSLTDVESELEQVKTRMAELNKLESPTLVEQDELKKLELTNEELEREVALLEREKKLKQAELEKQGVNTLKYKSSRYTGTATSFEGVKVDTSAQMSDAEYLQFIMNKLPELQAQRAYALGQAEKALAEGNQAAYNIWKQEAVDLEHTYDTLLSEGGDVARTIQDTTSSMEGTTNESRKLKQEGEAAVDAWINFPVTLDGVATKLEDVNDAARSFADIISDITKPIEAISSAQEDMAETGYLSAESVAALREAGLEEYLVLTEKGYKLAAGAARECKDAQIAAAKTALNDARTAAKALIDDQALVAAGYQLTTMTIYEQLQAMKDLKAESVGKAMNTAAKEYIRRYVESNPGASELTANLAWSTSAERKQLWDSLNYDAYSMAPKSLLDAEQHYKEFMAAINTAWRDRGKSDTADANKSEFEEEYAKQKHALELGKKTLKEFNDWLDGNDGYKKYFSDRTKYADEWRKYEKEVFDNSMQLHEQEATNLDHTIEMLKLQNASEQDILAVYRKKQTLLENARDLVYDFLKAQGLSDKQIASNSTLQELNKALLENSNEATDFYKERVDQNVADFEHVIDMLERVEGREGELIAKYREEQAYLVAVREEYRKTLVAAGKTADEIANDDWFQELTKQIHDVNDAVSDTLETLFDEASGHINDLLDLTEELVRHETEEMIDAYEKQKDAFSEIVDAKKEILQLTKREQEYNDKVAESTKDIAKLQSRIDALSNDDTRQAKMERAKLEEELAELQKSLADTQTDHYIEVTENALDKEEKDYHDLMDSKIKELEDFLDDNEAVTKETLKRLDSMNEDLFNDLLGYAKHYTDTTGDELTAMWSTALQAAEKYGSYTNSMKVFSDSDAPTGAQSIMKKMFANQNAWASTSDPEARKRYDQANLQLGQQLASELGTKVWRENGTWYIGNGDLLFSDFVSGNSTAKALVKQMQDNGEAWGKAKSDAERKVFEDANEQIGKQLQQMLGVPVWRQNGRWYIGEGEELYKVYGFHTGGVVGRAGSVSPKADELFALLQNDEVVMSRRMVDNAYSFLTGLPKVVASLFQNPLTWAAQAVNKGGTNVHIDNLDASVYFDGKMTDKELIATLQQYPRKVAEVVSSQLRKL